MIFHCGQVPVLIPAEINRIQIGNTDCIVNNKFLCGCRLVAYARPPSREYNFRNSHKDTYTHTHTTFYTHTRTPTIT